MGSYKNPKAQGGYSADALVLVYWEVEATSLLQVDVFFQFEIFH